MADIVVIDLNSDKVLDIRYSAHTPTWEGRSDVLINPDLSGIKGVPLSHLRHSKGVISKLSKEEIVDIEEARNPTWKREREKNYPALGDQLDALLKQLNYMRLQGQPLVQPLDDIIGQWLQVKEDYPKPQEETK